MTNEQPPGGWLDAGQQRAWRAFMRVQLRMTFEMNRQLQADSDLSLADYHVLNALTDAPGDRMTMTALATLVGWERSRMSHHTKRLAVRGLVRNDLAATDRRVTEVTLTAAGRQAVEAAAAGHVELVRSLFFDGLPPDEVASLTSALEAVDRTIQDHS